MPAPVNITEDLSPDFWTGSIAIGVAAVQILPFLYPVQKGVQIKADAANTDILYVGKKGVTAKSADVSDGIPLAAGEGIFIPIKDVTKIYIIADAAAQEVYWMAV